MRSKILPLLDYVKSKVVYVHKSMFQARFLEQWKNKKEKNVTCPNRVIGERGSISLAKCTLVTLLGYSLRNNAITQHSDH